MPFRMGLGEKRRQRLDAELARWASLFPAIPGVRKVVVFGSLAQGRVGPTSDVDLLIVQETSLPFFQRLDAVSRILEPEVAADILVYTPPELEALQASSSFVRHAVATGRALDEA